MPTSYTTSWDLTLPSPAAASRGGADPTAVAERAARRKRGARGSVSAGRGAQHKHPSAQGVQLAKLGLGPLRSGAARANAGANAPCSHRLARARVDMSRLAQPCGFLPPPRMASRPGSALQAGGHRFDPGTLHSRSEVRPLRGHDDCDRIDLPRRAPASRRRLRRRCGEQVTDSERCLTPFEAAILFPATYRTTRSRCSEGAWPADETSAARRLPGP